MPVSPARAAAFEILIRVERDGSFASELLQSDRQASLSTEDHGLATELVMGVLRWRSLLDRAIAGASSQAIDRLDREVLTALRIGVYQLRFLSRIPARAALFESVEIVKAARKRSAASFVNAVLRKISAVPAAAEDILAAPGAGPLANAAAHPRWLVERWVASFGLTNAARVCLYDQSMPAAAIHLDDDAVEAELRSSGIELSPGLLLSSARRVRLGDVTATAAFREGRISVQDEASQLIALLVGSGDRILDCCAAPGSKTRLLTRHNPAARVVALDLHPHRVRLLRRRVAGANVLAVAADARRMPLRPGFDRVLADVPCSGTGTLARNPEIKWRLIPDDLRDLQARQIAILQSALPMLSPGGRLLYSTCSLEREENEAVVERALDTLPGFRLVDCADELANHSRTGALAWKDVDSLIDGKCLRTLPGVHPCDGFFAAMIEAT